MESRLALEILSSRTDNIDVADQAASEAQTGSPLANLNTDYPGAFDATVRLLLSTQDKACLAKTCRQFNTLFKPELKQLAIDKLLTHVIGGEQAEAEKIIRSNPRLLLESDIVEDYSGRKIEGTALQMALGAEDVKYHDDEVCMVEMIHKYLKQLPNGEAIIAEQTAKQLPEGWQVKEEQRAMRDSDVLHVVINTIANSENPAEWEKAIHTLRNYLAFENKSNVIQTGKHFNHQLLVEALDLFVQNYNEFGGLNSAKNNAVWRKVIGTIERYIPAATAQTLCTGVGTIVEEKSKLKRSLTLHNYHSGRGISYFPLDTNSDSVLGQDFAVCSYYGGAGLDATEVIFDRVAVCKDGVLQNLCQTKTSTLQHYSCSAHNLSQIARPGV